MMIMQSKIQLAFLFYPLIFVMTKNQG